MAEWEDRNRLMRALPIRVPMMVTNGRRSIRGLRVRKLLSVLLSLPTLRPTKSINAHRA